MSKRKSRSKRVQPSAPRMPRGVDEPKAGPGQVFVQEGARESRHYRNIGHPLDLALERGLILESHWSAGNTVRVLCAKLGRSGKDSTQAMMAPGGSSDGAASWTQEMVDSAHALEKIEQAMRSNRSYRIVRYFCGDGLSMQDSVNRVTPSHVSNNKYRLIEALEDLEDALDRARIRRAA